MKEWERSSQAHSLIEPGAFLRSLNDHRLTASHKALRDLGKRVAILHFANTRLKFRGAHRSGFPLIVFVHAATVSIHPFLRGVAESRGQSGFTDFARQYCSNRTSASAWGAVPPRGDRGVRHA